MKHIIIRYLAVFIISFPTIAKAEIGSLEIGDYCSFNNEQLPAILTTFNSDNSAKQALERIMKYTGLPPRFEILASDVPNAAATIHNKKRYILYNQHFMRKVRETTRNNWSEIGILAHEIGHHLSNHTFESLGSRPKYELEADRFSGFILQKMGASLNDAVVALKHMVSVQGSSTHPPRTARIAAVTNGWIDAEEKQDGNNAKRRPVQLVDTDSKKVATESNVRQQSPEKTGPLEPKLVEIRGGRFVIGSPISEAGRRDNEKQRHITVKKFKIGKFEVTNAEYSRCVMAGACRPNGNYPGLKGPTQPVIGVSGQQAMTYAFWISRLTGHQYRLPTEAEWEYAARAGSLTAFPWGNDSSFNRANCALCGSEWDSKTTAPVGSFPANSWGIHDMNGNASEWTCSTYEKRYSGHELKCSYDYDDKVLRGGSWRESPRLIRSAYRFGTPLIASFGTGFRLVRTD